jgi:hypothetical protein
MIWDIAAVVGALTSGTAVLLGLLIDEPMQLHLLSALVFGAVPVGAALLLGAVLVCLLKLLGIVYDLLGTLVLPRIIFCVRFGMAFLIKLASDHKGDVGRVLVLGAGRLIRLTMTCVIWIEQTLRSARTRAGSGLALLGREIALEALWINQRSRSLIDLALFIAAWPIRSLARLALRLRGRHRKSDVFAFTYGQQDCR